jgi:hypothetical protein
MKLSSCSLYSGPQIPLYLPPGASFVPPPSPALQPSHPKYGLFSPPPSGTAGPSRFPPAATPPGGEAVGSPASERERALMEKEAEIAELENMAREAELRAEAVKKEAEMRARESRLLQWEQELERREREAQQRLAQAQRILHMEAAGGQPGQVKSETNVKPGTVPVLATQLGFLLLLLFLSVA